MAVVQGVNASLPADCPYRLREGQLDAIDISLPFPNLWSGPFSLGISSVRLTLDLRHPHQHRSDPDEPHGGEEWNLDKSIYEASSDFVRTVLNPHEDEQLQESLYELGQRQTSDPVGADIDPFIMTDSPEEDDDSPQAPGGFPSVGGAFGGPEGQPGGSARMIEGLVEALLARLQISIGKVVVHLHHDVPDDDRASVDLTLKVDGIRYALSQGHGSELPRKTLTFNDVGVWMSSGNTTDESRAAESPLSHNTMDTTGDDMIMSLGVAELRQSRVGLAYSHDMPALPPHGTEFDDEKEQDLRETYAESLYQSAIGEATSPHTEPPLRAKSSEESDRKIFGLESKGIVFQMWREADGAEGPNVASARISVDLGHLVAVVDTRQIESLIKVAAVLSSPGPTAPTASVDSSSTAQRQPATTQLQVVSSRVDIHYVYASAAYDASSSTASWSQSEISGRDNLHLSFRNMQVVKQGDEKTVGTLAACSLSDIYRQSYRNGVEVHQQPILQVGPTDDHIWLPAPVDAERAMNRLESKTSIEETHVRVTSTSTGRVAITDAEPR